MSREKWTSRKLGTERARRARRLVERRAASAESFLDELVTWRELAFNTAAFLPDFDRYEILPAWARQTLEAHRRDRRAHVYSLEQFEQAETHDPLWNAVQRQLARDGWFHGYMRMLWGKKILEWSRRPEDALTVMEHLMNKLLARRPRSEFVGGLRVGAGPLRSTVAGARNLRHCSLHELTEYGEETAREAVSERIR